ncbi:hypothetical protein NDU88_003455 [Pleurodeles waltl]|uniref:Uncharacterized protein n=1 Tax=Pleurodeles waltl TaxID=8319 RepID=A0AAV7RIL7_PLEWA|nr:hypothetical protein NDU88_003455 [Pleurodeles waltl]
MPQSPEHVNQQCAHLYRDPKPHLAHKTIRDLGSVAAGTPFRRQRHRPTGTLGGLLCVGEDRPMELSLKEALTEILEAYQHSQNTMGQILDNVQENRRLQEGSYQGIQEDLQAINTTLISIAGVLAEMANIMSHCPCFNRPPPSSTSESHSPQLQPIPSTQEDDHAH